MNYSWKEWIIICCGGVILASALTFAQQQTPQSSQPAPEFILKGLSESDPDKFIFQTNISATEEVIKSGTIFFRKHLEFSWDGKNWIPIPTDESSIARSKTNKYFIREFVGDVVVHVEQVNK